MFTINYDVQICKTLSCEAVSVWISNPHEVWISLGTTYCAIEIVPVKGSNVAPYNYLTIKKWHQIIIRKWPFVKSWKASSLFISQIYMLLHHWHSMMHVDLEGVVGIGICAPLKLLPKAGCWDSATIFTYSFIVLPCLSVTTLFLPISLHESACISLPDGDHAVCSHLFHAASVTILSSTHVALWPLHLFTK